MSETTKFLLKQVPVFSVIPPDSIDHLGKIVIERPLSKGEVLFYEGDSGQVFYIIKSGAIDIIKNDQVSNKQVKLATREKGDFFGEMSLLEDSPRFATARAAEESVVLELSRDSFIRLITEKPTIAFEVMSVLSSRLRQADLQLIHDLEKKNELLETTNRRLMETTEKLEKSYENIKSTNNFLQTIISASQFFIIATDSRSKIFIFNDAAKKIFNKESMDVIGKGIESVIIPIDKGKTLDEIEKRLAESSTWSGNILTTTHDNSKLFIELVGARVFDEKGDIYTTLYMGRDITDKTDKAPQKIDSMKNGLDKMTGFTDGLMMYFCPEIRKDTFDLNAFLENEMFFLKPQNRFVKIKFVFEFDRNLPRIKADKSQIQQVLLNLLNNAADATAGNPEGQRQIIIKTTHVPDEQSITISIIDNGVGFSGDSIDRVFRQHFTTKERGHGFGLLAVKRVIKNHSGKVWAEDNPDGGAIFNVQLPINPDKISIDTPVKIH